MNDSQDPTQLNMGSPNGELAFLAPMLIAFGGFLLLVFFLLAFRLFWYGARMEMKEGEEKSSQTSDSDDTSKRESSILAKPPQQQQLPFAHSNNQAAKLNSSNSNSDYLEQAMV